MKYTSCLFAIIAIIAILAIAAPSLANEDSVIKSANVEDIKDKLSGFP